MLYLNFVTVAHDSSATQQLRRNPEHGVSAGATSRPVSCAIPLRKTADITAFKAKIVPVGEDQAPLIKQTNEIVRRIDNQIGRDVPFAEAEAVGGTFRAWAGCRALMARPR